LPACLLVREEIDPSYTPLLEQKLGLLVALKGREQMRRVEGSRRARGLRRRWKVQSRRKCKRPGRRPGRRKTRRVRRMSREQFACYRT